MFRNKLFLRMVAIAICLAGMVMVSGCGDPNDPNNPDNPTPRKNLNEMEKELVGQYSYGSSSSGYWTYYDYSYDQWVGGGSFAQGIRFNNDGTFDSFLYCRGSYFTNGGSVIKTTANWKISVKGTVILSNYVENIEYADGSKDVWRQSDHPNWDPNYPYTFEKQDGKNGIMWLGVFFEKE